MIKINVFILLEYNSWTPPHIVIDFTYVQLATTS